MNLTSLAEVAHLLRPGTVLRWGIRDKGGALLLAKGNFLEDQKAVDALVNRGAFIDIDEVAELGGDNKTHPNSLIIERWGNLESRLSSVLKSPAEKYFLERVNDAIASIAMLPDGNSDLLIYMIMRHDHSRFENYGIAHSLHCAAICSLISKRLEWPEENRLSLIGAALTMNISMIELQGRLAVHGKTLSADDKRLIHDHPMASSALLRSVGLDDVNWLQAIEQHHEFPSSSGYPNQLHSQTDMARLLGHVDRFTAKHSPRGWRLAQPSKQAAQEMYKQASGDPFIALLIKEFGIYPPGTFVLLKSEESAIVVRRGKTANEPIVAAYTNPRGEPLLRPVHRDTSVATHAIVKTILANQVKVTIPLSALYNRK